MRKFLPLLSLLIVVLSFLFVFFEKKRVLKVKPDENIGSFLRQQSCKQQPHFLSKLHISQPVAIDLSQQRYKGLAFLYGQNLSQALHLKTWEKFDHFSSYALDPKGNMYLTPMPYISIKEKTFEFQKNIYKLNTNSGNLSVWMHLDDVVAGANNPYGITAIDYDCDDKTLWISAIDETSYRENRGVIYHIDIEEKRILQKIKGVDALSIKLIKTQKGKYLLVGSARTNELLAYSIKNKKLEKKKIKILELPDVNEHIRKILIVLKNHFKLKSIPFSYSLIAQTQEGSMRKSYFVVWDKEMNHFKIEK